MSCFCCRRKKKEIPKFTPPVQRNPAYCKPLIEQPDTSKAIPIQIELGTDLKPKLIEKKSGSCIELFSMAASKEHLLTEVRKGENDIISLENLKHDIKEIGQANAPSMKPQLKNLLRSKSCSHIPKQDDLEDDGNYLLTDMSPTNKISSRKKIEDFKQFKEKFELRESERLKTIQIKQTEQQAKVQPQQILSDCENVSIIEEEKKNLPEQSSPKVSSNKMPLPPIEKPEEPFNGTQSITNRSDATSNKTDDLLKLLEVTIPKNKLDIQSPTSPEDEIHSLCVVLNVLD